MSGEQRIEEDLNERKRLWLNRPTISLFFSIDRGKNGES